MREYILIDVGNTTTKYCFAENCTISNIKKIDTSSLSQKRILDIAQNRKMVISSVVPSTFQYFQTDNCQLITHDNLALQTNLENKKQVGIDRLINAYAATQTYKTPCCIVDSGTATTFSWVDEHGIFQGGSIIPGLKMASKALQMQTAQIPLIHVTKPDHFIGKNTKQAVESGLFYGFKYMVEGLINHFKRCYPQSTIIGTGSGLTTYHNQLPFDVFDEMLIFKGLKLCAK